ncbi:DUF397 domain-containing protein [Nocardiopsis terrae]|uniref:DUF397 domain-containing protein n=1 Tax=Nocardiopsis terrae TaxID=372655 RepID=UPI00174BBF0D|nr:DUF397 domain-containing protein [Nocardiopsis terrae]
MSPEWRTSSHSPNGSDCVACRGVAGRAEVRDSKHPERATLAVPAGQWVALLAGVRQAG